MKLSIINKAFEDVAAATKALSEAKRYRVLVMRQAREASPYKVGDEVLLRKSHRFSAPVKCKLANIRTVLFDGKLIFKLTDKEFNHYGYCDTEGNMLDFEQTKYTWHAKPMDPSNARISGNGPSSF